jgi:hypothetical protein
VAGALLIIFLYEKFVIPGKDAELSQKNETIRTISEERDRANRENEKIRSGNPPAQIPQDDKTEKGKAKNANKIIQWLPPEMLTNVDQIQILLGGHINDSGGITMGRPLLLSAKQIISSNGIAIPVGNYFKPIVVRIVKNRVFLDLDVPTTTKPIQIRDGKSDPLPDGWDSNCDSNELEIVDDQIQAVFEETFLGGNSIWIEGTIQTGGSVILMRENYDGYNPQILPHGRFNVADVYLITDFKYPSSKFQGIKQSR